jgi:hypothetical protein
MLYIYTKELLPVLIVIHSTYGKLYFHILNTKIYVRLNIKPCEKIFHVAGLTKPGEVGNFFVQVLMKSPYSCHKANF